MNEVPKDRYASTIDEHLRSRRGSALGLSAADWSAVEGWWQRGVPLWIILSAIDEVFERPPSGPLLARGLRYCAPIIEERYRAHLRTQIPEAPRPLVRGTAARMGALLMEASAAARGRGEVTAADLIAVAAEDTRALETHDEGAILDPLVSISRDLVRGLRDRLDPERLATLSREADEALAAHAERMTVAALRTTRERFLDRRVMEIFGIPDPATL